LKQSIASDAAKLTFAKIFTLLISMITAMLLSRFRTLEEYGTYSQLLLVVNLAITVFMLGIPNSINFFLAQADKPEDKQRFLSVYFTWNTIISLFIGIFLILISGFIIDYFKNPLIKSFLYVLAVYPWAKNILSGLENILIVLKKANYLMIFKICNGIFLLIIILIVQIMSWDFKAYMLLFMLVEVIFTILAYAISSNLCNKIRICFDRELFIKILNFSVPIGLASAVGMLNIELDKLVIGRFFSTEDLAIFTNAAREMPVTIIASALTAVLMPHLVRLLKNDKKIEAVSLWSNAAELSYLFICFFSLTLYVFAPEVITVLYSKKYLAGTEVFRIYSLVLLVRFTYFGMILNSIGKTKFILYSSIATLIINLILNFLFYKLFGFIGPAIATFVSIALIALFQLIVSSKELKISFKLIMPWKKIFILTIINIAFAAVFVVLKSIIPFDITIGQVLESVILGAVWMAIYIIIMFKNIKKCWRLLND